MRELTINGRTITDDSPAYVIAELSHSHYGNLELAKEMVRLAAEAGADAVKLQKRGKGTYDGLKEGGQNEYADLRERRELDYCDYQSLEMYTHQLGLAFVVTAFDHESADFLMKQGLFVDAIKIASGDITNTPLLQYVAQLGKPMIVSTGGASMEDVERAVRVLKNADAHFALLQCLSQYPCPIGKASLRVIETYRKALPETVIGFSSHLHRDQWAWGSVAAHMLGARLQEWHFTITPCIAVGEHAFAVTPPILKEMVTALKNCRAAMGDGVKRRLDAEATGILRLGKHLAYSRDLLAGHVLTEDDLAVAAPGNGEPPNRMHLYVGETINRDVRAGEAVDTAHVVCFPSERKET